MNNLSTDEVMQFLTHYHHLRKENFSLQDYESAVNRLPRDDKQVLKCTAAKCNYKHVNQGGRSTCEWCGYNLSTNDGTRPIDHVINWVINFDNAEKKLRKTPQPDENDVFRFLFELQEAGLPNTHDEIVTFVKNAFKTLSPQEIETYITRWIRERRTLKEQFDKWVFVRDDSQPTENAE